MCMCVEAALVFSANAAADHIRYLHILYILANRPQVKSLRQWWTTSRLLHEAKTILLHMLQCCYNVYVWDGANICHLHKYALSIVVQCALGISWAKYFKAYAWQPGAGQAILAPCWPYVGPMLAHVEPSWELCWGHVWAIYVETILVGGRGGSAYPARGPRGPELAVALLYGSSLLSEGERGRRPCRRPTPPTPYHQKVSRFTVFFAVPIFRLLWPKMGQHGPI